MTKKIPTEDYNAMVEWRKAGKHLPPFLRDFHDQKDFFKAIQDVVDENEEEKGGGYLKDTNFAMMQIYTIDYFLWFCARFGYTLQPAKVVRKGRRIDFFSLYDFVKEQKDKADAIFKAWLDKK